MKRNIGKVDKTIRLILAVLGVASYFTFDMGFYLGISILGLSGMLVLTVLMNWCAMCAIFGISTCEISPKK